MRDTLSTDSFEVWTIQRPRPSIGRVVARYGLRGVGIAEDVGPLFDRFQVVVIVKDVVSGTPFVIEAQKEFQRTHAVPCHSCTLGRRPV